MNIILEALRKLKEDNSQENVIPANEDDWCNLVYSKLPEEIEFEDLGVRVDIPVEKDETGSYGGFGGYIENYIYRIYPTKDVIGKFLNKPVDQITADDLRNINIEEYKDFIRDNYVEEAEAAAFKDWERESNQADPVRVDVKWDSDDPDDQSDAYDKWADNHRDEHHVQEDFTSMDLPKEIVVDDDLFVDNPRDDELHIYYYDGYIQVLVSPDNVDNWVNMQIVKGIKEEIENDSYMDHKWSEWYYTVEPEKLEFKVNGCKDFKGDRGDLLARHPVKAVCSDKVKNIITDKLNEDEIFEKLEREYWEDKNS